MAVYCTEAGGKVTYLSCLECEKKGKCKGKRDDEEKLADLINKLKISEDNYSKEELLSPRFRKAYTGLKDQIKELAEGILKKRLCEFIFKDHYSSAEVIYLRLWIAATCKSVSKALYEEKDVNQFLSIVDECARQFREKLCELYLQHKAS